LRARRVKRTYRERLHLFDDGVRLRGGEDDGSARRLGRAGDGLLLIARVHAGLVSDVAPSSCRRPDGRMRPAIITTRASRASNDATHRRRARRALLFLIHPRVAPRVPSSVHPPGTSRRRDSDAVASSPSRRRRAPAPSRRSAVPAREDRRRRQKNTKRNEPWRKPWRRTPGRRRRERRWQKR